jgi:high-affinity iron transporter
VVKRWAHLALLSVAALAVGMTGAAPGARPVLISVSGCGPPPSHVTAGPLNLTVENHGTVFATVYVTDPAGAVYAEIPTLPPGKALPLTTTLDAGKYELRCVFTDGTVRNSAALIVTGTTTGAVAGYQPLSDLARTGPVNAYRRWVTAALPALLEASRRLASDVTRGDLAAARTDWLPAHLAYERLGAAYNSFGDADDAINGRADGLEDGTAAPDWTGFHAIEYALWHGGTLDHLATLTTTLVDTVTGLIEEFPSDDIDPGGLPLRAHEILENAMQFQLSGLADYGSATTLATVEANIEGTQELLTVLTPLIAPREPGLLPMITAELARVRADLSAARSAQGIWTTPGDLPAVQRHRLNGDLGGLLEHLAVLPNLLAPRTTG